MKKTIQLLLMLLALGVSQTVRADYVDDINNAFKSNEGAGQHVIYEMNVGSFTSAGTFSAAQEKLADLKQLGVDIVWLMPIYPRGTSKSPYAATDFKAVNSKYGTISDLKAFVSAAHALNMQVWLDWVPNHTATNAKWVTSNPEYYKKSGGQMVHPNNYQDVYQLDYTNTSLRTAMNDCLKFWIDQADVDGYRCDYVSSNEIPQAYWSAAIPEIKNYKAGKTISFLGEADIAKDVTRLKSVGFDYDFAWTFQSSLTATATGTSKNKASAYKSAATTLLTQSNGVSFGRMLYLTNHDQNFNDGGKTLTKMYGDNRYALTVLTFTLYGMPLIYNGQECGGNQILDYFNDTKISWGTDNKMRNTLRTLSAMKHSVPALSDKASVTWLTTSNTSDAVLAYSRKSGDSEVLVLLNVGSSPVSTRVTDLTPGEYTLWLNSATVESDVNLTTANLTTSSTFTMPKNSYRVYVKGEVNDPSGISAITADTYRRGRIYTLSGQEVTNRARLPRGIYVQNGRKFVVKQ